MTMPKHLLHLSPQEAQDFINSFDSVFIDCDGVVWFAYHPIENVSETIRWLKENGKKVVFVSNNSTQEFSKVSEHFLKMGLKVDKDEFVNPAIVIGWYLNNVNFQGNAFVIGTSAFSDYLAKAGIKIADPCPHILPENIPVILNTIRKRPPVKAVIVDFDVNCNWIKMDLALEYLKDKNVYFITGSTDTTVVMSSDLELLGQGPFCNMLIELSKRQPMKCGKPSCILKDFIFKKHNITNPRRCLFVGDSLCNDIEFGALCNFQKLFVGSGVNKLESVGKISEVIPDYYLPSLGHLLKLIKMCDGKMQ